MEMKLALIKIRKKKSAYILLRGLHNIRQIMCNINHLFHQTTQARSPTLIDNA